ncbi:MAG: NHL repeat-containing protein [Anaerolineae bacterium]|nr:NHL repeat-containing protein [Anaerolineae bacterium]
MYAPRGVRLGDDVLVVADSGNHRVLIWRGVPQVDGAAADVVLGQPDFYSEGEKLLRLPTGVGIFEGKLFVADAWHHRILVWDSLPSQNNQPPDWVIGQADLSGVTENRGGAVNANSFYWPYGIGYLNGDFYVADTGNRRVMLWHGLPKPNQPADLIIGQDGPTSGAENRGTGVGANTFRWPHAFASDGRMVYVADAGNHRVLGWRTPISDRPADVVLGQPDFESASEFAYVKQGPSKMRFPYALAYEHGLLAVSDTANNRVLFWHDNIAQGLATQGCFAPAHAVIGQPDFGANGENRWQAVDYDTLCWPYGIHLHNGQLAVADSGNNRVMIWRLTCV